MCPECGADFGESGPESHLAGLFIEHDVAAADTIVQKFSIPWRVAFAPRRAFGRFVPLSHVLVAFPSQMWLYLGIGFVIVAVVWLTSQSVLDSILREKSITGWGAAYLGARHGSLILLPIHVAILWIQSVFAIFIGLCLKREIISLRQGLRLTGWIMCLWLSVSLVATAFYCLWRAVLARIAWHASGSLPAGTDYILAVVNDHFVDVMFGILAGVGMFKLLRAGTCTTIIGILGLCLAFIGAYPLFLQLQKWYIIFI